MEEVKSDFNIQEIKNMISIIKNDLNDYDRGNNKTVFDKECYILNKYPEFYESHKHLVKRLCKKEDMSFLNKMFRELESIQSGQKSLTEVETKLGNELADKFIKPHLDKS
jgi:hypothetical protein